MPALKTPQDMLARELKEIYSAEKQLSRALPKLAKSVASDSLRQMLERRREEGSQLIEALDDALETMGVSRSRQKNAAVEGLIEDVNQHVDEIDDDAMLDVALIGGLQKVEYYCIASWGTARAIGEALAIQKVVEAMRTALEQGRQFDQEMTQLAESEVNPAMLRRGEHEDEEGEAGEGADTSQSRASARRGETRRKSAS